jgi:DNA-directed RNA polymerase subunit beta
MVNKVQQNFAIRKNFAEIKSHLELPNLIDIQRSSWDKFLQAFTEPDKRTNVGLQGVFKSVFPIKDYNETASLEFVSYTLDKPKYDVDECRSRGMTFAAPIKVVVQLVLWDRDKSPESKRFGTLSSKKSILAKSLS